MLYLQITGHLVGLVPALLITLGFSIPIAKWDANRHYVCPQSGCEDETK